MSIATTPPRMYEALSHPPARDAGTEVDLTVYRSAGTPTYGTYHYKAPTEGLVQVGGRDGPTEWTDEFETDQPLFVADTIIDFIRRVVGRRAMGDINLGHDGIWKGVERHMIQDLRAIYGLDAVSRP